MDATDGVPRPVRGRPSRRTRLAARTTVAVNRVSRALGRGSGTVIGGRAGLALDARLVAHLAAGRTVALVSGTNGKTTTTRFLAVALDAGGRGPVASNTTGANMPAGHAAALSERPGAPTAVLEVDEGYVPRTVAETAPRAVVLLNLSRDQLDRTNEVRMTAARWRHALGTAAGTTVVANADDPLVVWGAGTAPAVVWVAAGLRWQADAVGCPACDGRIAFSAQGWRCACGFARPVPDVTVAAGAATATDTTATDTTAAGTTAHWRDGRHLPVALALPGRFNAANAVMAAVAAEALGVPPAGSLAALSAVREVEGRFAVRRLAGVPVRLLLAKNPAGWEELLDLVTADQGPVVVGINAREADGRDPSWLWDVAFERLRGRTVVATGDRRRDLSVRLRYAEVDHTVAADAAAAVAGLAGSLHQAGGPVDLVANYTAFHDVLRAT